MLTLLVQVSKKCFLNLKKIIASKRIIGPFYLGFNRFYAPFNRTRGGCASGVATTKAVPLCDFGVTSLAGSWSRLQSTRAGHYNLIPFYFVLWLRSPCHFYHEFIANGDQCFTFFYFISSMRRRLWPGYWASNSWGWLLNFNTLEGKSVFGT